METAGGVILMLPWSAIDEQEYATYVRVTS
jgi:hypothetical protein